MSPEFKDKSLLCRSCNRPIAVLLATWQSHVYHKRAYTCIRCKVSNIRFAIEPAPVAEAEPTWIV